MATQANSLKGKYLELIDAATRSGVNNLQVRQQEDVLYIDGDAPSEGVKKHLWDIYNRIDPDYRSADLVMNISAVGTSNHQAQSSLDEYTVVKGDTLSEIATKYGIPWKDIFEANKDRVKDPDLIQPGWKLRIPKKK